MHLFWLLCPMLLSLGLGIKLCFFPIKKSGATRVLGIFLFLFLTVLTALFLVSEFQENSKIALLVNLFSLLFYVAIVALPPSVYLYSLFLTRYEDKKLHLSDILHHYYLSIGLLLINLIAFVYFLIATDSESPSYAFTLVENVMTYSNFFALIFIFPIANVYYCYKAYQNYSRHKKVIGSFFSYDTGISLRWIKTFIIGYILFILFIYIMQISNTDNFSFLTGITMIGYLGYIGYRGDQQMPIIIENNSEETDIKKPSEVLVDSVPEPSLLVSQEKYYELKEELLSFMSNKKPYLDSKLTIQQLSRLLNTNNKYLSNLLNNGFNQNFVTFINSYRIEEAKILLTDPQNDNYTIETIAKMAGFHTKSSFNSAFKNFTNTTPSRYKKLNTNYVVE